MKHLQDFKSDVLLRLFLMILLLIMGICVCSAPAIAQTSDKQSSQNDSNGVYYRLDSINNGLSQPEGTLNLETPQACIEHFLNQGKKKNWLLAAHAMNFRLIADLNDTRAATLAEQFYYVLNQELWIDWESLPDRPDGVLEGSVIGNQNNPMIGVPRKNITLGGIDVKGREVSIHIQRVGIEGQDPVWMFSAQTVDNIQLLYDTHGPSFVAQRMPDWAQTRWGWGVPLWQWICLGLIALLAPLLGWIVAKVVCVRLSNMFPQMAGEMVGSLKWPIAAVVAFGAAWFVIELLLGLPSLVATVIDPMALILFVGSIVWVTMRGISFMVERILKQAVRDHHEDEQAEDRNRLLTQITVARHVILLIVVLVGLSIILIEFDAFRTFGVAILGSAGTAAILLGIAGHAVLGNLVAGLQIALAGPFQIGDTVFVEDNWGTIEDITYVDVIVRTWDHRRLVMPVNYFVSNWFENWSKTDAYLVKPIYLYVDYRMDVQKIREKFLSLVKEDDRWAGDEKEEPDVLVTDCNDITMTVRLTAGSNEVSDAWYMSCEIREKMIAWLQEYENGEYLPRRRIDLENDTEERK